MAALGMHPSLAAVVAVWAVVLGVTGAIYLHLRAPVDAGAFDVVLDRATGTVTLPAVLGRTAPMIEPFANVRGAQTERHVTTDSEGDTVVRWRTSIAIGPAGRERMVPVAEWMTEERAAALTDWLQERLKK